MTDKVLTDAQILAIGKIVGENLGANMQSGWGLEDPYIYIQLGPNLPLVKYEFYPDGTVKPIKTLASNHNFGPPPGREGAEIDAYFKNQVYAGGDSFGTKYVGSKTEKWYKPAGGSWNRR